MHRILRQRINQRPPWRRRFTDKAAPSRSPPGTANNRNNTSISNSSPASTASSTTQASKQASRIDRLISRSPRFLHKHLQSLRSAPFSHVSAFLILHELTAVIPLFGLAGAFHYYGWLPPYFAEGAWVVAGVEKFGRYARRKGWITADDEQEAEREVKAGEAQRVEGASQDRTSKWFNKGEGSVRWLVEFATAYAIVKAFLIPRLLASAWGAPWFARWSVIPLVNLAKGIRKKPALKTKAS